MSLAMVPLARLVTGFPRLVRDLAGRTGKLVNLELEGEDVELDKRVLDTIGEALGHLVTNAVDHGCETPAAAGGGRQARGRDRVGTRPRVRRFGDHRGRRRRWRHRPGGGPQPRGAGSRRARVAMPTVTGRSTPPAGSTTSSRPALSTRKTVSESSGRGVGLDVVRATVEGLGGQIAVTSTPGAGHAASS